LNIKGNTHLCEHVRSIGRLIVDTESRPHPMIERLLECRYTFSQSVLRIRSGTHVDRAARVADPLPHVIRPTIAMIVGNIGTQKLFLPELLHHSSSTHGLGRNSQTELPRQRPFIAVQS